MDIMDIIVLPLVIQVAENVMVEAIKSVINVKIMLMLVLIINANAFLDIIWMRHLIASSVITHVENVQVIHNAQIVTIVLDC